MRIRTLEIFGVVEEMEPALDPIDVPPNQGRELVGVGHAEIFNCSHKVSVERCWLLKPPAPAPLPRQWS